MSSTVRSVVVVVELDEVVVGGTVLVVVVEVVGLGVVLVVVGAVSFVQEATSSTSNIEPRTDLIATRRRRLLRDGRSAWWDRRTERTALR